MTTFNKQVCNKVQQTSNQFQLTDDQTFIEFGARQFKRHEGSKHMCLDRYGIKHSREVLHILLIVSLLNAIP